MASVEEPKKLQLYSYWRSSCSWRVRIDLHMKGLKYENKAVNNQFSPEFSNLNPMGYVPVLVDGDIVIIDSFAILMYLEENILRTHCCLIIFRKKPSITRKLPPMMLRWCISATFFTLEAPSSFITAASIVSSSIQPLQNLAKYIEEKVSPDEKIPWVQFHIGKGFTALEKLLNSYAGRYATGDEVFLADLFLAPQISAAISRFNVDVTQFPLLSRLNDAYNKLSAFQDTMPEKQPDAPIEYKG